MTDKDQKPQDPALVAQAEAIVVAHGYSADAAKNIVERIGAAKIIAEEKAAEELGEDEDTSLANRSGEGSTGLATTDKQFVVTNHLSHNGQHYKPGQFVQESLFSTDQLKELLKLKVLKAKE